MILEDSDDDDDEEESNGNDAASMDEDAVVKQVEGLPAKNADSNNNNNNNNNNKDGAQKAKASQTAPTSKETPAEATTAKAVLSLTNNHDKQGNDASKHLKNSQPATAIKKPAAKKPMANGWGFLNGSFKSKQPKKATGKRASKDKDSSSASNTNDSSSGRSVVKQPYNAGDDLPILVHPQDFFDDMVLNQLCENGNRTDLLQPLLETMHGRTLKIATMCSGTESPVLALDMIAKAIEDVCQKHNLTVGGGGGDGEAPTVPSILLEHVFSCEIEPFKQSYIERNFQPKRLFRDIRELGNDKACTAFGAMIPVPNSPGCVDLLVAGTSCVDFSNLNNSKVRRVRVVVPWSSITERLWVPLPSSFVSCAIYYLTHSPSSS